MTEPGDRLKALRAARGLSQSALARASGTPLVTISVAERTGKLSMRTAERVAPALGVSVTALLGAARRPTSRSRS